MEEITNPQPPEPALPAHNGDFPVVGLGASAGGLKALLQFFEQMPADSGMAFVVILHLSREHESHSANLLQNVTPMPVNQVNEAMSVEPNHVYVIPPTKHLEMQNGTIALSELSPRRQDQVAIDLFFRTLADSRRDRAICVVLSGTGSDGTLGLKRIKEQGGVTLAQSPDDAEYDTMPRNAIGTGMVDFVLPAAEMPDKLIQLWQNASVIRLPKSEDPIRPLDPRLAAEEALRDVLAALRVRTGHDFMHYKRATVLRRIERRMQVNQQPDLPAYRDFLRAHQEETPALLKDMLISVTNFFRDREAFDALEREVIPLLFIGKAHEDQVRVWCAGCATGEEAYSLAILLAECSAHLQQPPAIQVFATDIDENAVAAGREGRYPESIITDISPQRLRIFFTKEPDGYTVKKNLRERILFAAHNALKDPPFSRLDLIACRNLMIYLNRDVQEQLLSLFHFALRPGGYLFLGASESADSAPNLFAPLDKKHGIFKAHVLPRTALHMPTLPLGASLRKPALIIPGASERRRVSFGELHQRLLEQYAPPSVIINEHYDIVHLSDRAGRFLQFAGGEPSHNLLKVIHPELRLDLRTALFQAVQTGKSVEARRVRLNREGHTYYVNMIARPVQHDEAQSGFILVIFDEVEDILGNEGKEPVNLETEPVVVQLEAELQRTKEQLQATIEQYEASNEELRASNEELQAINEELRSTTEELETGKEELQSINEELTTVNSELKVKVEEVTTINDDLKNLIASTDIATIFIDRNLNIKRYTPRALEVFNLIQSDVGRPLLDITHRLDYENLAEDTQEVLQSLRSIEREVVSDDGRLYIARLAPYRTLDDRIDGAVLTFVDITKRKQAEDALRASEQRLRRMVNIPRVGVLTFDYAGTLLHINDAFLEMLGYDRAEFEERQFTWRDFTPEEYVAESEQVMEQLRATGRGGPYEKEYFRKDGSRFWMMFVAADLGDGTIVEYALDVTDRRRIEAALHESEARLRLLIEGVKDYAIITLDKELRITGWNVGAETMFGYSSDEAIGQSADLIFTPEDRARGVPEQEAEQARQTGHATDERWHLRKDGARFYLSGVMTALRTDGLRGYVKIARDLTERQKTEEERRQAHEELEQAVQERTHELSTAYDSLVHEVGERRSAEGRVKDLLRRVITTQEDERQRISRELHDHLGQLLTALQLQLAALTKRNIKMGDLRAGVAQTQQVAKQIDEGLDFLVWELRPAALDDLGLPAAIGSFVAEWSKHFDLPAEFHTRGLEGPRFTPELEINLYRIAQEALTNVAKHAQASRIDVLLERREQNLVLILEDNGIGFDYQPPPPHERGRGLGLLSMHERAALLGGTLEIESAPGSGTTVFVRVPLAAAE